MSKFCFITEPDDTLKCLICLEVSEDPRQHEKCGKLFCKKCLDEYGQDKPCLQCMTEKPLYFVDARGMYNHSYTVFRFISSISSPDS